MKTKATKPMTHRAIAAAILIAGLMIGATGCLYSPPVGEGSDVVPPPDGIFGDGFED